MEAQAEQQAHPIYAAEAFTTAAAGIRVIGGAAPRAQLPSYTTTTTTVTAAEAKSVSWEPSSSGLRECFISDGWFSRNTRGAAGEATGTSAFVTAAELMF